ncbi:class 1 isoprenoid biosynthesis enzyme [Oceanirhabdus sp. W0125-5]|uniref:class 1 isoprenoid biosynthesis enzyme n=1 Tax=Oceanirhabdus sp. W0125-5 TaxID=2999116 RepID=UPI0022F2FC1B|nr:class 1 isoprenoid biosynthesis enzyme [Oceanirhabdus sp. W0125-5]WBW99068.1 class 1 isoprenoid biosynthesis enzyme [Oceanirhabdus sp. W0125-5]
MIKTKSLNFVELKNKIEDIWYSLEDEYDIFPYRYDKKKDEDLLKMKEFLANHMNRYNQGISTTEDSKEILKKVQSFLVETLEMNKQSVEHLIREQFIECSREFVERAKDFQKNITTESVFQALRNIWTINSMQIYLNKEVKLTDSMFAYSMLYPLTDNFLDDKTLSREYKLEFNKRFRNKIKTGEGVGKSQQEKDIFYMIDLIEKDYPRAEFPEVFEALVAIQDGQNMSIKQHGLSGIYSEDILGISIYKGGASVLADAYLVCGHLEEADQLFAFTYGVILQIADDFQDIKEDLKNKHYTIMNIQTKFGKLDSLINKYCNFIDYSIKEIFKEEGEHRTALKELITESVQLLRFGAVIKNKRYISRKLFKNITKSNFFSPRVYTNVEKGVDKQLEVIMASKI